jgi:Protein of unknown function (DUF5132)
MSLIEDMFKGNMATGLAVAGAVVLAPTLLPAVGRILRPVAKTAIKGGLVLYRETLAGVGDVTGDLVAEARAELEHDRGTASGATADEASARRTAASRTGAGAAHPAGAAG